MDWFESLLKVVERVGFPIAVTGYLLWKLNGKLEKFSDVLNKISETLISLSDRLETHDERSVKAASDISDIRRKM